MYFIVMDFDQWPSSPAFILTFFQKIIMNLQRKWVMVLKDTKVVDGDIV